METRWFFIGHFSEKLLCLRIASLIMNKKVKFIKMTQIYFLLLIARRQWVAYWKIILVLMGRMMVLFVYINKQICAITYEFEPSKVFVHYGRMRLEIQVLLRKANENALVKYIFTGGLDTREILNNYFCSAFYLRRFY